MTNWKIRYKKYLDKAGRTKRNTPEDIRHHIFLERLSNISPNFKILSKYKNSKTHVKCECLTCKHIWSTSPDSLLRGRNCPNCTLKVKRKDPEKFLKEISNLDLICKDTYINNSTKLLFKCLKCNFEWSTVPHNILRGNGCPKCAGNQRKTHQTFLEEIKDRNFICVGEYKNNRTKVAFKCNECGGLWQATPLNILNGSGCPYCAGSNYNTLYILLETKSGLYKIGITSSLTKRLRQISSCELVSQYKLKEPDSDRFIKIEKYLHKLFRDKRTKSCLAKSGNTEFFSLNFLDLKTINDILIQEGFSCEIQSNLFN
jgi:predicted  nucleic acid-binding Zn-ribbon protein